MRRKQQHRNLGHKDGAVVRGDGNCAVVQFGGPEGHAPDHPIGAAGNTRKVRITSTPGPDTGFTP
jgi:hypothetical protein